MLGVTRQRVRGFYQRFFHVTRVVVVFAFIAAVVTVAAAARMSRRVGMGISHQPTTTTEDLHAARATLASALSFSPQPGATSVAADAPVVVHAGSGRLVSVRVTAANGSENEGAFVSPQMWASSTPLGYGTTYHATALVSDGNATVERTATFQTMTPNLTVSASVFPTNGLTVGVGQPIVLRLSDEIITPSARTSLLQHLTVKAAPAVAGGWYWFSPRELHFRPKAFWPSNEKVTVSWDLTGWNAGSGEWGSGAGSTHFTVGDARVSLVNLATHTMTVTLNGRTVAVYPISGGKPKDPTMDGVHIVLDRESVVHMVSSTVGIPVNSPDGYDELVYNDVHISDSGEYVHAAPWSVASQGNSNVSHGCVNLSNANALSFFQFSRVGDIVLIEGSPRPPVPGDHGVMDWDTPFTAFTPAAVVPAGQAMPSTSAR
ncbi:MAG TPA: Ig-like domain-containing protein [Acidimicrobiia bacterium]